MRLLTHANFGVWLVLVLSSSSRLFSTSSFVMASASLFETSTRTPRHLCSPVNIRFRPRSHSSSQISSLLNSNIRRSSPLSPTSARAFLHQRGSTKPPQYSNYQRISPPFSLSSTASARYGRTTSRSSSSTRMYVSAEDPKYNYRNNLTENLIYRQRVVELARQRSEGSIEHESFRLLPLFPLHDEVVFPDGRISLRLFEERYLRLFSTILAGEDDIDFDLADETSPYLATGRFGILWRTPGAVAGLPGPLAGTGVAMKIVSHEWMGLDGARDQLIVNCQAYKRFKVDELIRSEPVMEALVTPQKEKILPPERIEAEKKLCKKLIKVCDTVRKLSAEKAMRKAYFSMEETTADRD
eukprot:jgi/Bigna1/71500/fgenesh1_pg.15_\